MPFFTKASYWTPNPRPSLSFAPVPSAPPLDPVTLTCLDALLILGQVDSSTPLRQLLEDAQVTQTNGRVYSAAAIRRALDTVPELVTKSSYGAGYSIPVAARIALLGKRATQDNAALRQLALTRYRSTKSTAQRGYYYHWATVEPVLLAAITNDPAAFRESLADLSRALEGASYYRPDTEALDRLFAVEEADFWSWRHPEIIGEFLGVNGTRPLGITAPLAQTILDLYARHDLLEIDDWRRVELPGVYLIHDVIGRPDVRRKHVDLDLLAHLLQGHQPDDQLLRERIAVIEQRVDLLDIVLLLFGLAQEAITPAAASRLLNSAKLTSSVAGIQLMRHYLTPATDQQQPPPPPPPPTDEQLTQWYTRLPLTPFDHILLVWVCCWRGVRPPAAVLDPLLQALDRGTYAHLAWVEGELLNALARLFPLHPAAPVWRSRLDMLGERYDFHYLLRLRPLTPTWQTALQRVEQLTKEGGAAGASKVVKEAEPLLRTIWVLDFQTQQAAVKEQRLGKGGYTPGRKLRWEELFATGQRSFRTKEDLSTLNALRNSNGRALALDGYFNDDHIVADFGRLLWELVGHPRLYIDDARRIPVELRREEASVSVAERDDGLEVRFDPPPSGPGHYQFKKVTPTRYAVYRLDDHQLALCQAIEYGIDVPLEARDRLEASLEAMREGVTIHSDTDLLNSDLPVVAGSDHISAHLLPLAEGYRVEFLARPLPDLPLYYPPGAGLLRSLVAGEEGRRILERDLTGETATAEALRTDCPTLGEPSHGHYHWELPEELTALRFLLELRKLVRDGRVSVEYPRGQKLRLEGNVDFDDLELRVGKQRDWFQVDGSLRIDEDRVLDLQFLLEQTRNNDSGFVRLKEGEFVALTEELRQRIDQMEGLLHERGGKLQLPTLAAGAFAEVAQDLDHLQYDAEWEEALERIQSARHLRPRPPEHFNATLRDYQTEGYDWMMRLAAWGVGACLADDMGLGKTVQALAVLTARAEEGPALVLAPASVIRNWRAECERFAPALRPVLLAHSSDTHLVEQLQSGDVLLVSYGLLTYVNEELGSLEYGTIVIDEAQAIKNSATKRARIVSELRGKFKVATTGTPIENHLGELWSLFRFLNPGLLSSKKAFGEKYAIPIARGDDKARREQLRKLVQPFILRRRKDEVLKELPAKTEVVLNVTPGPEEAALYEAMRRTALKEVLEAPPEQKKFIVLAQLTKLRQAACNPKLVRPKSKIPSAKLQLVGETILELLDNGHKALIFSQFVRHLRLVEQWVQGHDIPYQYLDGSTPGRKRAEAVEAFQSGQGQLFLISLKAGGTGLNLTAADYVLHLDPWWNPAAEDQASDRAHRIGQQRPVTVYRFVTEGTIEEQVLALHADKRDLADQILAGTGEAGQLEVDQILEMLKG